MAIKQIQLRGISRTPSDRMTQDGGCAESMNVHLDSQETAPTLPPKDISDAIYGEDNSRLSVMFIHKMMAITNYIAANDAEVVAYGEVLADGKQTLFSLGSETVSKAVSLGNTLIVYTDKSPHYLLFEHGAYINLGTEIPTPDIEIISEKAAIGTVDVPVVVDSSLNNPSKWINAKDESDENHAKLLAAIQSFWDQVQVEIDTQRSSGLYCAPFFIVYALRMFDGTYGEYIKTSVPILCGAGVEKWITANLEEVEIERTGLGWALVGTLRNLFELRVRMKAESLSELRSIYEPWVDAGIITSIDFFASTPIYTPAINAAFDTMSSNNVATFYGVSAKEIEDAVISKANFYKIRSFALNDDADMNALIGRELKIENSDEIGSGEHLVVKEELPFNYRNSNQYMATSGEIMNFNNRELIAGAVEKLTSGYSFLNGQAITSNAISGYQSLGLVMRFRIVDSTGQTNYVLGRYGGSGSESLIMRRAYIWNGFRQEFEYYYDAQLATNVTEFYSWLAYPDTRCDLVEIYMTSAAPGTDDYANAYVYAVKQFPMKQHPSLECSYAFVGFGQLLWDLSNVPIGQPICTVEDLIESENNIKSAYNKLYLSEFENPFMFPASNILTFPNNIVGVGVTSAPLSEGQVGDFDMYVFTEGGIRVLSTNSEGTFSRNNVQPTNLSRHVALPGTITALEQAIVFITKRGVMLLSGGTVTELSRYMNGMPYTIDSDVADMIADSPWSSILPNGQETLMDFMNTASVAYDHNGARLIFFNPEKEYQYVYMLGTQTWHKLYTGLTSPTILNSYPDCLVAALKDEVVEGEEPAQLCGVFDFTTVLDNVDVLSDTANPVKGVIVTRPFDLGEPDIRKAIRSIRIRGRYNREDVAYILMGSFDGIHWQRLSSLRGGSYKLFRMIILTNLSPTERISWIDVDYESRFANKLR